MMQRLLSHSSLLPFHLDNKGQDYTSPFSLLPHITDRILIANSNSTSRLFRNESMQIINLIP